jgi:hypothetical protein
LARLSGQEAEPIADIAALRDQSLRGSGGLDGLPTADLVPDMTAFRTERRGRRR